MSRANTCPACRGHDILGHSKWDYIQMWECLDCGYLWNRWPEGSIYFDRAQNMLNGERQLRRTMQHD